VLLDQNYTEAGAQRYAGLVPSTCLMLLGTSYALLRKEFSEMRRKIKRASRLENVLVFFTAGNDQGETLKAMHGLKLYGCAKQVDVVVGPANTNIDEIQKMCAVQRWGYHCQVDYMASLIAQADLVIGAGGSSNWERCALGVPALLTVLADNQAAIAAALNAIGVARNLGWYKELQPQDYADALSALGVNDVAEMSAKAMEMVDGLGALRVADALLIGTNIR
jgi:spore coat polysaccharide biosynthesis predicted glycosyltransferase SpsG